MMLMRFPVLRKIMSHPFMTFVINIWDKNIRKICELVPGLKSEYIEMTWSYRKEHMQMILMV